MTTHTLTGDLGNIIGETLSPDGKRPARVWVVPHGVVVEDGEVRLGPVEVALDNDDAFSVAGLPTGGYEVRCRYFHVDVDRRSMTTWTSGWFLLDDDADLGDIVADDLSVYVPVRGVQSLSVSGAVDLDAGSDYELTLTDDTDVTIDGSRGVEVGLFVHFNDHSLTVNGETIAADDPATVVVKAWFSEWRIYVSASTSGGPTELTQVTPTGVTFNDLSGTENDSYLIPADTGVVYKIGGTPVTPDLYEEATGTVTVTADPAPGYEFTPGADEEWSHTFSAATAVLKDVILDDEPDFYLPLDDESGTTTPEWETGSGSITNTGVTFGHTGIFPGAMKAAKFENGDYLTLPNTLFLSATALTIEAVVYTTSAGDGDPWILSQSEVFHMRQLGDTVRGGEQWHASAVTQAIIYPSETGEDAVYHAAVTWDGIDSIRLYVNGILRDTETVAGGWDLPSSSGEALSIHREHGSSSANGEAYIGHVAIYRDRALTVDRMLARADALGLT